MKIKNVVTTSFYKLQNNQREILYISQRIDNQ